jgi:endonuclease III
MFNNIFIIMGEIMDRKLALKQLKELDRLGSSIRLAAEEWGEDWKILISTIMSARTKDEVTIPVAEKLFSKYSTLNSLSKANVEEVQKIIKPVNFYITKSKNVLNCAKVLVEFYDGNVPLELEELIQLPGVGRKTANVFLSEVGKYGIGIDTHLSYISQHLGWTNHSDPLKIELDLKKLFPKFCWNEVNPVAVRFGKTYTRRKKKDELLDEIKSSSKL